MNNRKPDMALIISKKANVFNASNLLGTGGWLPPREREALDWITLIKWMGWKSKLIDPKEFNDEIMNACNLKWIILTDDPDEFESVFIKRLFEFIKIFPLMIISRSGKAGSHFSNIFGAETMTTTAIVNTLDWIGVPQHKSWPCKKNIRVNTLECRPGIEPLVTANEKVFVAINKKAAGKWIVLSFHPSEARDLEESFTSLLKYILVYQSCLPVAWFNFENTMVLRMDDPGSSETVHHSRYQNTKLTELEWAVIGEELQKRNARMTLGYVPGWVDDGDDTLGNISINGKKPARRKGKIYPSPLVKYESLEIKGKKKIYDYESEFRGIQQLRKKGLVEVELHGYTHIHPDKESWINAPDRYNNEAWYREFGRSAIDYIKEIPSEEHPFRLGLKALQEIFKTDTSTLICPGDEFTNNVLMKALEADLMFVSSYYLAVKIGNKLYWDQYVSAPYFDTYNPTRFNAGLPVIGYFHDFDVSIHGVDWFSDCLKDWQTAGAKYFIDFKELAGILSHTISLNKVGNETQLNVQQEDKWKTIRAARISAYFPETLSTINFECDLRKSVYRI
ncbi:MAG: hypothetical protein JWN56_2765 [Sphingobacteriales bacterium]|nr:hypothetical protein [Sphingobacteriales bacterium]